VEAYAKPHKEFKLYWVTDFPLFEYDEESNRWVAASSIYFAQNLKILK